MPKNAKVCRRKTCRPNSKRPRAFKREAFFKYWRMFAFKILSGIYQATEVRPVVCNIVLANFHVDWTNNWRFLLNRNNASLERIVEKLCQRRSQIDGRSKCRPKLFLVHVLRSNKGSLDCSVSRATRWLAIAQTLTNSWLENNADVRNWLFTQRLSTGLS